MSKRKNIQTKGIIMLLGVVFFSVAFLIPGTVMADGTGGLVSVQWIACSKNVPARMPVSDFKHIPWDQNLDSAGNLKNAGQLIEVYEGAGVLKYAEIVCYSDSVEDAAMTYYALRTLGYPQVRVYLPPKGAL